MAEKNLFFIYLIVLFLVLFLIIKIFFVSSLHVFVTTWCTEYMQNIVFGITILFGVTNAVLDCYCYLKPSVENL